MTNSRKTHQEMEDDEQAAYLAEWSRRHKHDAAVGAICFMICFLLATVVSIWAWFKL